MKRTSTSLFAAAVLLFAFHAAARAQTITIDSISGTTFCAGDPIGVTFTATGTWGHKNAFTLQFSNDSGSFDNGFQNLGSIQDTVGGTFTIVSTIPLGFYQQQSIARYIDSEENVKWKDTVIISYDTNRLPHDTLYDTTQIPKMVWAHDTTYDTTFPTHSRVRIMGANPYTVSADNGTDLIIGQAPEPYLFSQNLYRNADGDELENDTERIGIAGIGLTTSIDIESRYNSPDEVNLTMGDGSDPSTLNNFEAQRSAPQTTYTTTGMKMLTMTSVAPGGCSYTDTTYLKVFDCTTPVIPNNAIVISNDTFAAAWDDTIATYIYYNSQGILDTVIEAVQDSSATHPRTFWVNPGVTFYADGIGNGFNTFDTIFAESGANINFDGAALVYLKPGATATEPGGLVIYGNGASIINNDRNAPVLECDALTYDYTVAPPNSIMHVNEGDIVAPSSPAAEIEILPNPTTGTVALENVPAYASVTAMNVLGQTVTQTKASGTGIVTLDLSQSAPGTYYIRIASGTSVVTKAIVKE